MNLASPAAPVASDLGKNSQLEAKNPQQTNLQIPSGLKPGPKAKAEGASASPPAGLFLNFSPICQLGNKSVPAPLAPVCKTKRDTLNARARGRAHALRPRSTAIPPPLPSSILPLLSPPPFLHHPHWLPEIAVEQPYLSRSSQLKWGV